MIVTRAYRFALDPTARQAVALLRHAGAARVAYNWALAQVKANLSQREAEKSCGIDDLTPSFGWHGRGLDPRGAVLDLAGQLAGGLVGLDPAENRQHDVRAPVQADDTCGEPARLDTKSGVDLRNPLNLVPAAAGIIIGIGNVTLKFTDTFSLSGIALGTLVVITGYHALRALAPAHLKTQEPLLDEGTSSYDAPTGGGGEGDRRVP